MNPDSVSSAQRLVETLAAAPVVAILRARRADHLVAAAEVIADAGTLGAFAVATRGDWEGLPRRTELPLLEHHDDVVR